MVISTSVRLQFFTGSWEQITKDHFVLEKIRGYKLVLEQKVFQIKKPHTLSPNKDLDRAIGKLIISGAIEKCCFTEGQFISSYFLVLKPDGSHRFILNLKKLNDFVKKEHFKMEDIRTAVNLLNRGDYMFRLDLKDAYLQILVSGSYMAH